jgi:CRISPR-associated protein Csm4
MSAPLDSAPETTVATPTWRLRLRPTSPWATPWHADSLFGALAWRCAEAYGEDVLLQWIAAFKSGKPPFLLSDALPGDWFPAPIGPRYQVKGEKTRLPVWVNASDFRRMLKEPGFRSPDSPVGGEMSTSADRRQAAIGRISDRTDAGGALFEVEQRVLSRHSGEFFSLYVRAESHGVVESLLALLSLTGFGKKSSTGLGAFRLEGEPERREWLDGQEGANGFVSLSHFVPAPNDPTEGGWQTQVSYPKYHGSAVAHPFKGKLVQFVPGSWFCTGALPRSWYGRVVPAGCPEYPEAVQYGLAFAVPAKVLVD